MGTHQSLVAQGGLYHNLVARQQYGSDTIPESVSGSAPSSSALSAVAANAVAVGAAVGAVSASDSDSSSSQGRHPKLLFVLLFILVAKLVVLPHFFVVYVFPQESRILKAG